ncbi:MAG: DUF4476 domain-containing protein [Chitinophagaceae bacterium]|nr:DUF4476 domain-containing protein [Chitinophagaceae bacterium]
MEELSQPYYSAKIIFADSTLAPISKSNLMIADVDGIMKDVTYKIRKDKSGKLKMNYFSSADVKTDYIPPSGVYIYHYGRPAVTEYSNGTVRTTTTMTTTEGGVNASISMNGINMNMTVNDPFATTTTTTTTTTSTSNEIVQQAPAKGCNGWPMGSADFAAALKTISNSSFEDSKLSTAKNIAKANCLSCEQVISICRQFSFEESKLNFAKYAFRHTTDPKNYFKVNDVFSFESSKEELNNFTGGDQ